MSNLIFTFFYVYIIILFTFVNMSITNRIQELIEEKNLSKSAFAKEIGIQRSSLAHFFSGRNKPSLEFFLKIKNKYPEIDLNWIISGKRTKHKEGKKQKIKQIDSVLILYKDGTYKKN